MDNDSLGVLKWSLFLNLKLQPQNDPKLWMKYLPYLSFKNVDIPELNDLMEKMCLKISCGYVTRFEREADVNIPIPIKIIIANRYLLIKVSVFKLRRCSISKGVIKWKNEYLPSRLEDGEIMDFCRYPPTHSLILISVDSLSD